MAEKNSHREDASAERERTAAELFPFRLMSPEEFAARNAADIACFSLDDYRYRDPALDAWIQRLGEILRDWKIVNQCRERYLTAEEMRRALERDREEF